MVEVVVTEALILSPLPGEDDLEDQDSDSFPQEVSVESVAESSGATFR